MKLWSLFFSLCVMLTPIRGQTPSPIEATLPNGKTVHFQSEDQKRKFLAAQQKLAQISQRSSAIPGASNNAPASHESSTPFITLDAVRSHGGNDYTYNWITDYGSYDMSFRQSAGVGVHLQNKGRSPADLDVRWIFFARRNDNSGAYNNQRFIYAASGKELHLDVNQENAFTLDSPMIESRDRTYVALGERYLEGSTYEGWLVQVLTKGTGQIIKQMGSTSFIEDLAQKPDFARYMAEYRRQATEQGQAN